MADYGVLTEDLWIKKLERTCMQDNPADVNNYHVSLLRDYNADKETFTQYEQRSQGNQNVLRSSVLNLRHHGARSDATPDHPDLFLGSMDRDTYHGQPDFRKIVDQAKARMKYKDLRSDHGSDFTIASGGVSDYELKNNLAKAAKASTSRMKIFRTAWNSFDPSKYYTRKNTGNAAKYSQSDELKTDAMVNKQRKSNLENYQDQNAIGYRQTTDHRFKIATYSSIKKQKREADNTTARKATDFSQLAEVSPQELTNRLMKYIADDVKMSKTKLDFLKTDNNQFMESEERKQKIAKLAIENFNIQQKTQHTMHLESSQQINNPKAFLKKTLNNLSSNSISTQNIVKAMAPQVNLKMVRKTTAKRYTNKEVRNTMIPDSAVNKIKVRNFKVNKRVTNDLRTNALKSHTTNDMSSVNLSYKNKNYELYTRKPSEYNHDVTAHHDATRDAQIRPMSFTKKLRSDNM